MTTELLPCPGCRDIPYLDNKQNIAFWVECGCGWAGPRRSDSNRAIELWNTRARPAAAEAVELAKKIFDECNIGAPFRLEHAAELLEAYRAATWSAAVAEAGKLAVDFKLDTSGMTPEEAAVQTAHQIACEIQGLKPTAGGE